jgi:autotransporter translocation and assembly factor TamB
MRKRWMASLAAAVLLVGLVVVERHQLIRFALERAAGSATGYSVQIGDQHLGIAHGALIDVYASRNGQPVLAAARVDLYYSLRDLLPGSTHRFGLTAIAIDHPVLTVMRSADRSINLIVPTGSAPSSVPGRTDPVPLRFTLRLRNGSAQLVYGAPKPTTQNVTGISADATIDTSSRTHYVVSGAFQDTASEPFRLAGAIDVERGYAIHHLQAVAVPIRAIGNFIIDESAARILAGTAHNLDAKLYALDVSPAYSGTYHTGARLDVNDGQMYFSVLAKPLKNISGRLQIVDDAFFARNLDATLASVPVVVNGGIFNFRAPQIKLGISGVGDLTNLRQMLAFSRNQPVSGAARAGVLLEGPLGKPIVVAHVDAANARYRTLPLENAHAEIAVAAGTVIVSPLRASYGGIGASARGSLILGKPVRSEFMVRADGPGARFPYLDELLPGEPIAVDAVLAGTNLAIGAHGAFSSARDVARAGGLFVFAANGVADIAPFYIDAGNGTLYGRYRLDRRNGASAFWIDAANMTVRRPTVQPFPGVKVPGLPALDGRIAGIQAAGGGPSGAIAIAGRASAGGLTIGSVRFDTISGEFGGGLADVAIDRLHATGPWGRFEGDGAFSPQTLVARGSYAGTLGGLHPFLGGMAGTGTVSGPAAIAVGSSGVVVQSSALTFANATLHGVPISRFSGTIAYRRGVLSIDSAQIEAAGGSVVAAGKIGPARTVAFVGNDLRGEDARALGLPLDAGTVSLAGVLRSEGKLQSYTGGVVVRRGRSQGFPVQGTASIAMNAGRLHVDSGVVALGAAFGIVSGNIDRVGLGSPSYALHDDVPAADVDDALATLKVPNYKTQGVFNAQLAIGGSGALPSVSGAVGVPGGEINGLPFIDASADLYARAKMVVARKGRVQVGSTGVAFFARVATDGQSMGVRARRATLSDFNNFFDTGDTLAGTGAVAFSIVDSSNRLATRGNVDVRAFRYRALPIGDTTARWSSQRNVAHGTLAVNGTHGALRVGGTITLARAATLARVIAGSSYDVSATLANLDLSTWLPAIGYPGVPLLGRVNGSASVVGSFPHLAVTSDATLVDGSFARLPIDSLTASIATTGNAIELRNVQLQAPGLSASAVGSIGLRPGAPLRLSVHASSSDVPKLIAQVAKQNVNVKGTFETTLDLGGTLAKPTFAAAFDAQDVDAFGLQVASLFGSARINGGMLEVHDIGATFAHGQATLAGSLPLRLSPFGFGPPDQALSFDLDLQGVDPSTFDGLLGSKTSLGGAIDGHVGLSGTLIAPRIVGQLTLRDGTYVSALERAPISNAVATLDFGGTSAKLVQFEARFGSGTVKASGDAAFEHGFGLATDLHYGLHVDARGAQVDLPAYGAGSVDATIDLARTPPGIAALRGTANLSDATIRFSAFLGSAKGGTTPASPPAALGLNLKITAGQKVRVRGGGLGAGLNIGATGTVAIAGTLAAPSLDGVFTSTGGSLTYFDRAFRVQSGQVVFTPGDGLLPTLHGVAFTSIVNPDPDRSRNPFGSTDITIKVDGRVDNLAFAFESDPPGYTRDQIIALVAPFGGFMNGIAFDPNTVAPVVSGGDLPGGIPAPTGQPVPGVQIQQNNTITVGQEAFNILNAQITSGLLAPIENVLGQQLGLENLSLTVDYYGNVGLNVRRRAGQFLNAVYASTFGIPQTQTFGLQYAPSDLTSAQLTFFFSNGPTVLFAQPRGASSNLRVTTGEALAGQSGFAFTLRRFFK